MNNKVLVAMSGGVDSSVAAYLLKEQGYECIGATMRLGNDGEDDNIYNARHVCEKLGIDFYVFDCAAEFKKKVIDSFVAAYEKGLTPNPCIECNKFLKFGLLYREAKKIGCDYIATGHYAVVEKLEAEDDVADDENVNTWSGNAAEKKNNVRYLLKRARDKSKDQSYFLYSLTQEQLQHTLFPLGDFEKFSIRKIAVDNGFTNAARKDSQDVCFVSNEGYASFIKRMTGKEYPEGNFIDVYGHPLGTHSGIINYTIGQRKGLGVALNEPMYVKSIDAENNAVVLAKDRDLYSRELIADNLNILYPELMPENQQAAEAYYGDVYNYAVQPEYQGTEEVHFRCKAKIRYRHLESDATVYLKNGIMKVVFDEPQRAVTKGQAVVLYNEDYVLGGGTII